MYALLIIIGLTYPIGMMMSYRALLFEAFVIPTGSMTPTILRGDRLLANKLAPRLGLSRRGDLIVFRSRDKGREFKWVKRVIGLPGDKVAMQDGVVLVNGKPLSYERAPLESLPAVNQDVQGEVSLEINGGLRYHIIRGDAGAKPKYRDYPESRVPDHHLFVLGDNRDRSRDSRQIGFVHVADVVGRAEFIFLPAVSWSRFGAIR